MNQHFLEKNQIVSAIVPVNLATGANNGDWVNMKDYGRCAIIFHAGAGAAGQDPTITVLQAQSDGGSSKALNFTRVDRKQGTALTAQGQFTTTNPADGNTYTNDTLAELQKLVVIDISIEDFDVANGYGWLQASIADVGSTSQVGAMLYILHEPRYSSGALPSAIA